MTTIKTAARDLVPGDTLEGSPAGGGFAVVLDVSLPGEGSQDDKVYVTLGRTGPSAHGTRIYSAAWALEASVDVMRPDLTPAQRHAELLLGAVKAAHGILVPMPADGLPRAPAYPGMAEDQLRRSWLAPAARLIEQADPTPPPPTLDEALEVLQAFDQAGGAGRPGEGSPLDRARKLLKRVPK